LLNKLVQRINVKICVEAWAVKQQMCLLVELEPTAKRDISTLPRPNPVDIDFSRSATQYVIHTLHFLSSETNKNRMKEMID